MAAAWTVLRLLAGRRNGMTGCVNKRSKFIQISVSQLVLSFKAFHKSDGSGAGVHYVLVLRETGAFLKQVVCETLLFTG